MEYIEKNPMGIVYLMPNIKELGVSSLDFELECWKEAVEVTAGCRFGSLGEGYFRINFGNLGERAKEFIKRIRLICDRLRTKS